MGYLVYLGFIALAVAAVFLESILKNKTVKMISFLLLLAVFFVLGVLKGNTVGTDTSTYSYMYNVECKTLTLKQILSKRTLEYGFFSLMYLFSAVLKLPEITFVVFNFVIVCTCLFFSFYKNERKNFMLVIFMFIGFFCMSFSGIRQAISISLVTLAFTIYFKHTPDNWIRSAIIYHVLIVIAMLFHKTSIILIIVPLLCFIEIKFYQFPYVPVIILLFFPFLIARLSIIMQVYIDRFLNVFDSRISITMILEVVLIVLSFFLYGTKYGQKIRDKFSVSDLNFDANDSQYAWVIYLGLVGMCFNSSSSIVSRFNMFFYIGIVYFLNRIGLTLQKKNTQTLFYVLVTVFLGGYFVISLPWLELVPYVIG